ncbi:hypothetical protein [Acidicapsa ligni]|uniref:hypothetical protein n=1 Tax=Acidicapsa ligni TaxID=542300 RepID=UPI0021E02A50|nr:hypothetical protein [Acidicapsa ligni]
MNEETPLKYQTAASRFRSFAELHNIAGCALILFAAVLASGPRFLRGVSCGHDFNFHLLSWMEVQTSWSQGVLYPHWAQSPNWGAGEARFLFYPPISWITGAILGYATNWQIVPAVFTFLCLTATGFATRALAREFLPDNASTLAGMLATATPYTLFTGYERTAFSELAAAALIPLLLLFALRRNITPANLIPANRESGVTNRKSRVLDGSADGSTAPLALVLAVTWLTNAPAGVMASYLLAFVALAAAILHRSWWPVLRALFAVLIGLPLAAFYLIPAAYEQRWVAIQQVLDIGMRVRDSWLFAHHSSPDLLFHDQVLHSASIIVVLTVVLAVIGFGIAYRRGKLPQNRRSIWIPLALLIPVVFLLQFPISSYLWNLPRLQFLQFPWRWLMALDAPLAIFLAAMLPLSTRRARALSLLAVTATVLLFTAGATHFFFQPCDDEDQVQSQVDVFHAGTGVEGTDEYAALGSDNSLVAAGLPQACLVSDPTRDLGVGDKDTDPVWYPEQGSCDDVYTASLWQNEHKQFQINSDHEGFVVLRLRRYPAWQITVNGKQPELSSIHPREDGLIAVPVTAGPSSIDVQWSTTPDVRLGRWVSLCALLLLIALWITERRTRAVRLSLL